MLVLFSPHSPLFHFHGYHLFCRCHHHAQLFVGFILRLQLLLSFPLIDNVSEEATATRCHPSTRWQQFFGGQASPESSSSQKVKITTLSKLGAKEYKLLWEQMNLLLQFVWHFCLWEYNLLKFAYLKITVKVVLVAAFRIFWIFSTAYGKLVLGLGWDATCQLWTGEYSWKVPGME